METDCGYFYNLLLLPDYDKFYYYCPVEFEI